MKKSDIEQEIIEIVRSLDETESADIDLASPLIGDNSMLDSMKLVDLCISLEDKAADLDFEFDWTSDVAMSKSRSIFRTVGSLANEFFEQMELSK